MPPVAWRASSALLVPRFSGWAGLQSGSKWKHRRLCDCKVLFIQCFWLTSNSSFTIELYPLIDSDHMSFLRQQMLQYCFWFARRKMMLVVSSCCRAKPSKKGGGGDIYWAYSMILDKAIGFAVNHFRATSLLYKDFFGRFPHLKSGPLHQSFATTRPFLEQKRWTTVSAMSRIQAKARDFLAIHL